MSLTPKMRSPRAFAGGLAVLAGVPAAIVASNFGADAQAVLHVGLGLGFLLFAWSALDFRTPRWFALAACAAIGVLAVIFLLQAASTPAPALRHIAYDVLGQQLEKILGYAFLLWCLVVLITDGGGWRRILGAIVLAAIVGAEGYALTLAGPAPDALKLAYLPLFVWLLLEGLRAR